MISRFDRPALTLMAFWVLVWCADSLYGASSWWYHDLAHHHYPWRAWAGAKWAAGELPLWAPMGHGFPFLAESQAGALYPFNILFWTVFSDTIAFNWSIAFHHLLALWGTFSLARYAGRSSTASLVAAVAYGFSGFFVSHLVYLGFFQVMAWFPWMITAALQGARYGGGWWPMLALTTAMVWLCGHPQGAYLATLAVVFVLLWQWVRVRRTRRWSPLLVGAATLVLAAVMSFPQWAATLELVQFGVRSEGLQLESAAMGSLPPEELVNAILPRTFGYERPIDIPVVYAHRGGGYVGRGVSFWETCFYLGIPTVLMMLVAGWSKATRMWWVLLGLGTTLMLGVYTPLFPIFQWLPGMSYFRFPVRAAMWVSLAASMLAASGVDRFTEHTFERSEWGEKTAWKLVLGVLAACLLISAANLTLRNFEPQVEGWMSEHLERDEPTTQGGQARTQEEARQRAQQVISTLKQSTSPLSPYVAWAFLLGFATSIPWLLARRGTLSPGAPGQLLVGLMITDLFLFGFEFTPRVSTDQLGRRPESAVSLLGVSGSYRTTTVEKRIAVDQLFNLMPASLGLRWGLEDVGIPSPLRMRRNERYLNAAGLGFSPLEPRERWKRLWEQKHLLDLSGLRFLFTTSETRSETFRELWSSESGRLYENTSALPRAFLVGCTEQATDDNAFEAVIHNKRPGQVAVVEGTVGLKHCHEDAVGAVSLNRSSGGGWLLEVEASEPSWLVLTETFYPHFYWEVDGSSVDYYRTNYLFQGIPLDAGSHVVKVQYRPMWLYWALALSWLVWAMVLLWMMVSRFPGAHRIILEIPVLRSGDVPNKDD